MNQNFMVYRDNQQYGPFSIDDLRGHLAAGTFNQDTDLAWQEGMADWLPLKDVIVQVAPPAQPVKDNQPTLPQERTVVSSKVEAVYMKPRIVIGVLVGIVILIAVVVGAYRSLAATNGSPKAGDVQSTQGPSASSPSTVTASTDSSSPPSESRPSVTQDVPKAQPQSAVDGNWNVSNYIQDNGVNKFDRGYYASIHDGKMSLTEWVAKDTIGKEWEYDGTIVKSTSPSDDTNALTYDAVITLTKFPVTWKVKCIYTKPGADGTGEALTLIAPGLTGNFKMVRTNDSQPPTTDPNQMSMAIPITDQSIAGTYQGVNSHGGDAQLRIGAMPQSDLSQSGNASFDLVLDTNNPNDYVAGTWTRDGNIIHLSAGSGKSASGRINSDGSIDLIGISFKKQ